MKKSRKLTTKLRKYPTQSRAEYLVAVVDRIIKAVHEMEDPDAEHPVQRLLAELYSLRGFVEGLTFPEDDQLRAAKKSLQRSNAGRKKGSTKSKSIASLFKQFAPQAKNLNIKEFVKFLQKPEYKDVEPPDSNYFKNLKLKFIKEQLAKKRIVN